MVIVIHQQLVPSRPPHFQAHLVLETNPPFRLILYWITLPLERREGICYSREHWYARAIPQACSARDRQVLDGLEALRPRHEEPSRVKR